VLNKKKFVLTAAHLGALLPLLKNLLHCIFCSFNFLQFLFANFISTNCWYLANFISIRNMHPVEQLNGTYSSSNNACIQILSAFMDCNVINLNTLFVISITSILVKSPGKKAL